MVKPRSREASLSLVRALVDPPPPIPPLITPTEARHLLDAPVGDDDPTPVSAVAPWLPDTRPGQIFSLNRHVSPVGFSTTLPPPMLLPFWRRALLGLACLLYRWGSP